MKNETRELRQGDGSLVLHPCLTNDEKVVLDGKQRRNNQDIGHIG